MTLRQSSLFFKLRATGASGGENLRVTKESARKLIRESDEIENRERVWRLMRMLSAQRSDWLVCGGMIQELYFQEARLCWVSGAYVSTIIMTQLAFEEMLRSMFRRLRAPKGVLRRGLRVDRASFFDLIRRAKAEGWISETEAETLNRIREQFRNPYVHIKGERQIGRRQSGLTPLEAKFLAPSVQGGSVIAEAQEAIQTLVTFFPVMSTRLSFVGLGPKDDDGSCAQPGP